MWKKGSNFSTCAVGADGISRGLWRGPVPRLPRAPWCLSRRVAKQG